MKRIFTILMAMAILAVVAVPSFAQGRGRRNYDSQSCNSRNYDSRSYDSRAYDSRSYGSQGYDNSRAYYDYGTQNRNGSVWDRHRDKLTVGAGTVGGAIPGSLIGGRMNGTRYPVLVSASGDRVSQTPPCAAADLVQSDVGGLP